MVEQLKDEEYKGHTIRFYKTKDRQTPIIGTYDDDEFGNMEFYGKTKKEVFDRIKKHIFEEKKPSVEDQLERHMQRMEADRKKLASLTGDKRFLSQYHSEQFSAMLDLNVLAWETDVRAVALTKDGKHLVDWTEGDISLEKKPSKKLVAEYLSYYDVRELTGFGESFDPRVGGKS